MADKKDPQNNAKRLQKLTRSEFRERPLYGVWQDSNAHPRVRAASPQALTLHKGSVTRALNINSDRSKKHSTNRRTLIAAGWVEKPISQEIDRIATESGLTRSRTIATLLNEAVHQRLHIHHAVMLSPLVRKAVLKAIQGLLPFLISIAYDANQTRNLTGNLLAHTVRPEEMERIREKTAKKARESILHQRPQLEELVEAAKGWFTGLDPEEADPS
jgi:hypothetical protein